MATGAIRLSTVYVTGPPATHGGKRVLIARLAVCGAPHVMWRDFEWHGQYVPGRRIYIALGGLVGIDFSRLATGDQAPVLDPRDIFDSLPNDYYSHLRLEQGEVLKEWFANRARRDSVIKLNTGGGKTLVGLLVCQSSIEELGMPAVYLVSDTYLVHQVCNEAERLGISVTEDFRDPAFARGDAILVATVAKLINGRSTFGRRGGAAPVVALGVIVFDDAHAAARIARQQCTAILPRGSDAYQSLLPRLRSSLIEQSASALQALVDGDATTPLRVPFWTVLAEQQAIREAFQDYVRSNDSSSTAFTWPLVQDHLAYSSLSLTRLGFEINPPCVPVDEIPSLAQCPRRVFMTATLSVSDVLVTEFDVSEADAREAITPERATDLGDRVILVPQAADYRLTDESVRDLAHAYAVGDRDQDGIVDSNPLNVIVLVPSEYRARPWLDLGARLCLVGDLPSLLADIADKAHLGLVVLVNKYDGVDLPNDACRVLVVDGVPAPNTAAETRESIALGGTDEFSWKRMQALEQGMGRGVRNSQDYCAVLVMGRDLVADISVARYRPFLSPGTRAQVSLSERLADQLQTQGLAPFREAINRFLGRDREWVRASKAASTGVGYDGTTRGISIATARRAAFKNACDNRFEDATRVLRAAIDGLSEREAGWYLEEVAMYQASSDAGAAQRTLVGARDRNRYVLRPRQSPPRQSRRATGRQARNLIDSAKDVGTSLQDWSDALRQAFGMIEFAPNGAVAAEEGMALLGRLLGFASEQPERDSSAGPDVLWWLTPRVVAVIELKTEVQAGNAISRRDANQLSGSVAWAAQDLVGVDDVVPILVHPSRQLRADANMPEGSRVLTESDLARLIDATLELESDLPADLEQWQDARVAEILGGKGLNGTTLLQTLGQRPERDL